MTVKSVNSAKKQDLNPNIAAWEFSVIFWSLISENTNIIINGDMEIVLQERIPAKFKLGMKMSGFIIVIWKFSTKTDDYHFMNVY